MKKLVSLALLLLLAGSTVLFASGGGEKPADTAAAGPITLREMEHLDRFNYNAKILPMFEKANPNIKIEYIVAPQAGANFVHDKEVTMLAAKDGSIDVFVTDVIWPPEYAAAGWLEPLDDVFPADLQKKYIGAMIDAQTINGKIYGVPWLNDIGHMFYRKDLLDSVGAKAPVLWSDLVQTSQKLMGPNMIGYAACFFQDQQLMCNYYEYLFSNNGQFLDSTGKKTLFTEKPSVEAVQFMVDLVNKYKVMQPGVTTMGLDDGRIIFTEGRSVFHRNWNYVWATAESHPDSKIKGKTGTSLVPHFPNGPHVATLGGWSYSVNAFSKHKAEAKKLAMFLGGPEAQKIRALDGDRTPTMYPLLSDPDVVKKYPVYLDWQKEAESAKSRPKSPFYTQLSTIFQAELQNAILMKKSPEQAMKDAADQMKPILK
jgi:multiple sugar transport system substrate-binding protein